MSAAALIALDPAAAAYVRRLHEQGIVGALAEHGDRDPSTTLAVIQRTVETLI
jgi:hypothetical protein